MDRGPTWLMTIAVALLGGMIGGWLTTHVGPVPKREVVLMQSASTKTYKNVARLAERIWPELEQKQVDDLTAMLRAMTAKAPALILCRDRSECGDMALDLENAFETAKWPVKIDVPFDEVDGITTNDPALLHALGKIGIKADLVNQTPPPTLIAPEPPTIVIGRRPRL